MRVLIRQFLLVPLMGGTALVVAGIWTDSTAMFISGIVASAIGMMIAGIEVRKIEPSQERPPGYVRPVHRFSAKSPDGQFDANIAKKYEAGEESTPVGDLRLSDGLVLDSCAAYPIWSDDSRYLALPRQYSSQGFFGRSFHWRLLVIDTLRRSIFASRRFKTWPYPRSFAEGELVVGNDPGNGWIETTWNIPDDLDKFANCTYEGLAAPSTSMLGRTWPFLLGLFLCSGTFFWQLAPIEHPEVRILYQVPAVDFAGWLWLLVPLAAILWYCIADKPEPRRRGELDRSGSGEMVIGLAIGWIVLVSAAAGGAFQLGRGLDAKAGSIRVHHSAVSGKQARERPLSGFRQAAKVIGDLLSGSVRPGSLRYYVSTRVDGQMIEFGIDVDRYNRLKESDNIDVIEITGRSSRKYLVLV